MKKRVYIFDTTLRDGEQVPGCQLNTVEKIEIAKALEELGVDVIEAGFPISSPGDFNSVVEISKAVKKPIICALTRAKKEDIDVAAESLEYAKHKRIHTGLAISDIHLKFKLKKTREQALNMGVEAVKYAKKFVEDVEFYAEDAGRADKEFLAKVVEAVIKAGATVINIPDTTGYCLPDEFGEKIKYLVDNVQGIDKVTISVHCHNDLGLATANTIAGVKNGATQVEVTMNGIGERAGNTSLEEVAMILKVHKELERFTNINSRKIFSTSRLVSRLMRMPVQPNKAIVGRNAFAHSSGIHQHGVIKKRETYEIINPEDVGIKTSAIVLTARSGRTALKHRLEQLGYSFSKEEIRPIYEKFLKMADKKRELSDSDLLDLLGSDKRKQGIVLESIEIFCGKPFQPMCQVILRVNGKKRIAIADGNGPVNAAYKAIDKIVKEDIVLEEFLIQAITKGSDDFGRVHIQVSYKRNIYYGYGMDTDIVVASVKAYLDAINKIFKKYEK